ncbi:hypothetical protein AO741_16205 [Pseudomonas sp. TTU2014-105ASC]|nr:hypothetical protein AO741_16205 [Pseudomonas sp. TTU2014-105ASC]
MGWAWWGSAACTRLMSPRDPHHAPEHGERNREPAHQHHYQYQRRFHPVAPSVNPYSSLLMGPLWWQAVPVPSVAAHCTPIGQCCPNQ